MNGFFGVGVYHPKREVNVGTLLRSAHVYGAKFVFTIGVRYRRQATDTTNVGANIPVLEFESLLDAQRTLRYLPFVAVELDKRAVKLTEFEHPKRAVYLVGADDYGLSQDVLDRCDSIVQVPTAKPFSLNLSVAGSIVLADRFMKGKL